MKKIRHPNVAQLFQIMETSNRMYFVMEFIQGGELYTKITSNKKYSYSNIKRKARLKVFGNHLSAINECYLIFA